MTYFMFSFSICIFALVEFRHPKKWVMERRFLTLGTQIPPILLCKGKKIKNLNKTQIIHFKGYKYYVSICTFCTYIHKYIGNYTQLWYVNRDLLSTGGLEVIFCGSKCYETDSSRVSLSATRSPSERDRLRRRRATKNV